MPTRTQPLFPPRVFLAAGVSWRRPCRSAPGRLRPLVAATTLVVSLAASPPSRLAAQTRVAPEERPPLADEEPGRPTERPAPTAYLGRTVAPPMHYSGAGWLTRASREQEEHPRRLLTALAIQPGQTLCDFGCGNGYHTLPLARRTGPRGMVFAVDIQPEMLELLRERASLRGVENIRPVLADPAAPELPAGKFDLILMVDVYHEIADPPPVLAAVREALAPTGRLALVEFREEDPEVPILPLHKMSQNQVHQELTANDFKLVEVVNSLPWQHLMCYARSDSPLPAVELAPWQPAASEPGQEAAPGDPVSEPEQETQIIAR